MKDETKEILDNTLDYLKGIDETRNTKILTTNETNILLDYITNLQEENEEWNMIFDGLSERPYAHRYLEEKRKELGNDRIIGLDSEMVYKDYYDLRKRIDKVIEYLEAPNRDNFDYCKAYMIQILQGKSDE